MKTPLVITKERILKIKEVLRPGLVCGLGEPIPGQMCVEAAICFAFDLPHDDQPPCVGSAVRSFKIALNDSAWSNNHARALGMKKLAVAQLGSDAINQMEFGKTVFLRSIQKLLSFVFRKVSEDPGLTPEQKAGYLEHADWCEKVTTLEEAKIAAKNASAYASASASAASAYASAASAYASAYASASAYAYAYASASAYAYASAASAYAYASAASAWFRKNLRDEFLRMTGEIALEVLIEMKSPGCEWLSLVEDEA